MEEAYTEASFKSVRQDGRLAVLVTSLTSLAFIPFDLMTLFGERLAFFLSVRLAVAVVFAAALVALAKAQTAKRVIAVVYLHLVVFFSVNALVFAHPVLDRHGGAMMPIIAVALWMSAPGSFRARALICLYAPAISLVFWGGLRSPPERPLDLAIIIMLTIAAYSAGAVARIQFGRMRREEFLHIVRERQANRILLEAKEAAEAGARTKAEFLAMMSHEIRTPMNGVLGMLRLGLEGERDPQLRERLEIASSSAEALLTILDDILDFSKLEAGKLTIEAVSYDPRALADGVCRLMRPRADEKQLSLIVDIAADVATWRRGDPTRLRQVLFNLIGNALKFTSSGSVTLRLEARPEQRLRFAVIDTGIGIPPSSRSKLFEDFGQLDASIARQYGGTGLGLAICKRLVELMGGTIDVDSEMGRGSTFWFEIPAPTAAPPAAASAQAPADLAPGHRLRILLAEDNVVNQKVALGYLAAHHAVTVVGDGAEAVAAVAEGEFDLVLMDMQMPRLDGLEATRRIRALAGDKGRIPVIALTANALTGDDERCLASGMNDYVAKPFDRSQLFAAIHRQASCATSSALG